MAWQYLIICKIRGGGGNQPTGAGRIRSDSEV